ncbi:PfkB domain protein [Dethiobacter alkaliphilus AHT 1]|uniref:PfkB domain protein n=2 Tax=Dethiobacter TaxID=427925 RepID=C0GGZ1_DETAL|nr:PfkB domain protein [Dethiobacter alkaliphilus AHT 1]
MVFGEVLFDDFGDKRVLGGAPFNVAWHLQGFGLSPCLISRVGRDAFGEEVLSSMEEWGMDTRGIQIDDNYPTGTVNVEIEAGEPNFHILAEQAYDFIEADAALKVYSEIAPTLLYHGTLVARNGVSAGTLQKLRDKAPAVFMDINLRPPWWQADSVIQLLEKIRWVKVNEQELATVAKLVKLPADAADKVRRCFENEILIVTCGDKGASFYDGEQNFTGKAPSVEDVADTVGAGDAFSAVTIMGLWHGWDQQVILERALHFAAEICRVQGATVSDPAFYRQYEKEWAK